MKFLLNGVNGLLIFAGGAVLASVISGSGVASASPAPVITVQDGDSGNNGAGVDSDGTQGDYKAAMDGTNSGAPVVAAVPQTHAGR